jgi:hypothetical protein
MLSGSDSDTQFTAQFIPVTLVVAGIINYCSLFIIFC